MATDENLLGARGLLSLRARRCVHLDARLHHGHARARVCAVGDWRPRRRPRQVCLRSARQRRRGARGVPGRCPASFGRAGGSRLRRPRARGPAPSGLALQSGLGRAVRHFPAPPRASALIFAEPHVYGHLPRRVSGRVPVYAFRRRLPHHAFDVAARALSAGQRGSGGRRVSRHLDRLRRSACESWLERS